jgi:hypothetical protein
VQHHTSTTPDLAGLRWSLWIDRAHHNRLVEVIHIEDHELVRLRPIRDARLHPASYLESIDHLSGSDYERVRP